MSKEEKERLIEELVKAYQETGREAFKKKVEKLRGN
jgi:ribosomal protein S7